LHLEFADRTCSGLAHRSSVGSHPRAVGALVNMSNTKVVDHRQAASKAIAETVRWNACDPDIA
jgi:hypothetical protein